MASLVVMDSFASSHPLNVPKGIRAKNARLITFHGPASERLNHIVENHDDLAGYQPEVIMTVEDPDWVSRRAGGVLAAWKGMGRKSYLVVLYIESHQNDGFIVTAFFTNKAGKKRKIWP